MAKTWKKQIAEELLAFGKTGAHVVKDFVETGVTELGKCAGHKKPFKIETTIAWVEWAKSQKSDTHQRYDFGTPRYAGAFLLDGHFLAHSKQFGSDFYRPRRVT